MSDMISNFVSQTANRGLLTNMGNQAAQFGGNLSNLIIQRKNAEREKIKAEEYKVLTDDFFETGNTELLAPIQAMYPEKYEGIIKVWDDMDEITRKVKVQENMNVIGYLSANMPEKAADELAMMAKAYRANGDDKDAERLQDLSRAVLAGDAKDVQRSLEALTGVIPEGKEALDALNSAVGSDITEGEFAIKIMKEGAALKWDQKTIDAAQIAADRDKEYGDTITSVLNYANALEGGMALTPGAYDKQVYGLRDEWHKYTEGFRKATESYDKVNTSISRALALPDTEGAAEQKGLADLAGLTSFQRMIDDGIVRAEDVNNIKGANAFIDRLGLIIKKIEGGDILSDDQRKEMLAIAEQYQASQKKYVDEYAFIPLKASFDRLNPEGDRYTEVFGKYGAPEDTEVSFWDVGKDKKVPEKETVPEDMRAFYKDVAKDRTNWTDAEREQIEDPDTPLSVFEGWTKTLEAYKISKAQGSVEIPSTPIVTTDSDLWAGVEEIK